MRDLFVLLSATVVVACSATETSRPVVVVSSYHELPFADAKLDRRMQARVSRDLPVLRTDAGDAFVLPINVPPGAKSLDLRSIVYVADSKTLVWNVSYPTLVYFDAEMRVTRQLEPQLTAVWKDGARYNMYFETTLDLPSGLHRIAAVFSPQHFGYKLNYDALLPHTAFGPSLHRTAEKADRPVPIGPNGLVMIEFGEE